MSRMGKEFSLVLVGSGILTAGHFLSNSNAQELEEKAEDQAAERVGHDTNSDEYRRHRSMHLPLIFWMHSPAYAGSPNGRPATHSPKARRSGFGAMGRKMGGGS